MDKKNQQMNTQKKNHRTRNKLIISIAILLIIALVIVIFYFKNQNAYETSISSEDFIFNYNIGNQIIEINITPLNDIKNFQFTITIYGNSILQQANFSQNLDFAEKNKTIVYNYSTDEIKNELFNNLPESVQISNISGLKQNRYKKEKSAPTYNQECDFIFYMHYVEATNDFLLYAEITNKTNETILGLKDLKININFEKNISCSLHAESIIFKTPLESNKTIRVSINDKRSLNVGLGDKILKHEIAGKELTSLNYDHQQYNIISKN